MKRAFLTLVAVVAFALSAVGSVSASHQTIPSPSDKNCKGQATAYLAQGGETEARGIGNVGREAGLTTKQVQDAIDAYCALA